MVVRIASVEVCLDCFFRSGLIWVCSICLGSFGRQLVFKSSSSSTVQDSYAHFRTFTVYRESYMSAHVLLNLLNKLRKRDKM